VVLLLWRTIRIQRYRMQETAKPQQHRRDDPRDRACGQNGPPKRDPIPAG